MAAIPFLWLARLHAMGQKRDAAWWWVAGAFFVSWIADTAAHWANPNLVGNLYPLSQTAIVAAVLLPRQNARFLTAILVLCALATMGQAGVDGFDVVLRTVAWGTAACLAYIRRDIGPLAVVLLVTFGLGLVTWYGYAYAPSWTTWGVYQSARVFGIGLFCWASFAPSLKASHRMSDSRARER